MIKTILAIFFIAVGFSLAWLGIDQLLKKDTLPVKRIVMLQKLQEQDAMALQTLASGKMDGGFFSLDITKFRKAIETLPWIETVSVRKQWPDTLQLNVKEKNVASRWINSDDTNRTISKLEVRNWNKQSLLSDKGVIFKTKLNNEQYKKYKQLAIYSTPDKLSKKGLSKCKQIDDLLKSVKLEVIKCFQDQRRTWYIKLNNGFNIFLGNSKNSALNEDLTNNKSVTQEKGDKILLRVKLFVLAYQRVLKKYHKNIDKIDMRYTNGFAIKWKVKNAS